jgi:hypothetical protein
MAFRKKGSRRIIVDGIAYRWRVPHRPTQDQEDGWPGVLFTVSPLDCDGAVLVVGYPRNYCLAGPCADRGTPILPSEVARRIREARAAGWQVDRRGPPCHIRVAQAESGPPEAGSGNAPTH